jgi:hypothetical protein
VTAAEGASFKTYPSFMDEFKDKLLGLESRTVDRTAVVNFTEN